MTRHRAMSAWLFSTVAVAAGLIWLMMPSDQRAVASVDTSVATSHFTLSSATAPMSAPLPKQNASAAASRHSDRGDNYLVREADNHLAREVGGSAGAPATKSSQATVNATHTPLQGETVAAADAHWSQQERWRYDDRAHPDLRGRDFRDAELRFVDLANADLRGANFEGASLSYADLRSANLKDAVIRRTNLAWADLRNVVLRGTDMGPMNLSAADLRDADLRDARLACRNCSTWSLVAWANLSDADLRGAHFGASKIYESIFDRADLRGANLAATGGLPTSLRGALYNDDTRLPKRIDPEQWGMVYMPDDD